MASVSAEIRLPDWLATMALPPAPVSDEACMRLAIAAQSLVGAALGAASKDRAREVARQVTVASVAVSVVVAPSPVVAPSVHAVVMSTVAPAPTPARGAEGKQWMAAQPTERA